MKSLLVSILAVAAFLAVFVLDYHFNGGATWLSYAAFAVGVVYVVLAVGRAAYNAWQEAKARR